MPPYQFIKYFSKPSSHQVEQMTTSQYANNSHHFLLPLDLYAVGQQNQHYLLVLFYHASHPYLACCFQM